EIDGGGSDTFNVSSNAPSNSGNLSGIEGTLTLVGGAGAANRLIVSDLGGTASKSNIVLTSGSITGFAPAAIYYSASGDFSNGASNDGILLQSSNSQPTTFNVLGTLQGSTTKIQTGLANDTVNVGNLSDSLGDVRGRLTIDGQANTDTPATTLSRG